MRGRRFLIVGPAWVGDMVMAQSLFKSLAADKPECVIDVVAPSWSLPLLARMREVRRGVSLPVSHGEIGLKTRYQVGKDCRKQKYDQAIVIPRSLKAALVPWFARIPRRTGYRGESRYGLINDMRPLDRTAMPQIVQRYVALGQESDASLPPPVPQPKLDVDHDNAERLRTELDLTSDRPVVALMPGAEYGPAKQWPLEYYGELAARLAADDVECWVLGSEKERSIGEIVIEHAGGRARNLCGRTRLEDAVDLLAIANVAVSNDSGLMHVAAAVECPMIAIYGSSTPSYTPPLSDLAEVIYLDLECSPCFERNCPLGHTRCLKDISVGGVYEAVGRRLSRAS